MLRCGVDICLCVVWSRIGCFFFFKQKTAYEMRISDWSSDVCSSVLPPVGIEDDRSPGPLGQRRNRQGLAARGQVDQLSRGRIGTPYAAVGRSDGQADQQPFHAGPPGRFRLERGADVQDEARPARVARLDVAGVAYAKELSRGKWRLEWWNLAVH